MKGRIFWPHLQSPIAWTENRSGFRTSDHVREPRLRQRDFASDSNSLMCSTGAGR